MANTLACKNHYSTQLEESKLALKIPASEQISLSQIEQTIRFAMSSLMRRAKLSSDSDNRWPLLTNYLAAQWICFWSSVFDLTFESWLSLKNSNSDALKCSLWPHVQPWPQNKKLFCLKQNFNSKGKIANDFCSSKRTRSVLIDFNVLN